MEIAREKVLVGLHYNRLKEQTLDIYLEMVHLLLTFTVKLNFPNNISYIGVHAEMTKGEYKEVKIIQLKHGHKSKANEINIVY